ncbi:MAG: esterase/lipase family protein [Wenzhouxiangella sp.]
MSTVQAPFFPIIYVRGYAMTPSEIAATTATPYMGFNLGSTKIRQRWDGEIEKHYFESPLIRLMKDYGYTDAYTDGREREDKLDPKTIFIHRYYDVANAHFGEGRRPSILEAARELRALIARIRQQITGDDAQAQREFRVYLVAHSMGGLICRCLLQNAELRDSPEARQVDKVFTYAAPHNGIELVGMNVPGFLGVWDVNNFNRSRMRDILSVPADQAVNSLCGHFDPERFFCLVGTNHQDYDVAAGMSRRLAGERSDGLVLINNASVAGAPRAFVHRTHGGAFGIVNSEEGYQNLVRFLFGDLRADGFVEVEHLPLPPSVAKRKEAGESVRASYFFEASVTPRGAATYALTERSKETHSAVFRSYDELFKPDAAGLAKARWPYLFSVFLDTARISHGRTVVFGLELVVSATDYVVAGRVFSRRRIAGECLYRDTLVVRATRQSDGSWRLRYVESDEDWGERTGRELPADDQGPFVPLSSRKGFRAKLRLSLR